MKVSTKFKKITASVYLNRTIDKELSERLSYQAFIWPSLGDVQMRVVRLFGDVVPASFNEGEDQTLLDVVLKEMADIWDEQYEQHGKEVAFKHVFLKVFDRTSDLFKVMVTSEDTKAECDLIWDPIRCSFSDFATTSRVCAMEVIDRKLTPESEKHCRQLSLLLLPQLFGRPELNTMGIAPYAFEDPRSVNLLDLLLKPEKILEVTHGV